MKVRFNITLSVGPKFKSMWLTVEAPTFWIAYQVVQRNNPGWKISCAWPLYGERS